MFSFSAWGCWNFTILVFLVLPKWFNCGDLEFDKAYRIRSRKMRLVDFCVRISVVGAYLAFREDTGWYSDVWKDLTAISLFCLGSGLTFKYLSLRKNLSGFDLWREFAGGDVEDVVIFFRVLPSLALGATFGVQTSLDTMKFIVSAQPTVIGDVTSRPVALSSLQLTRHESGVYEYTFVVTHPTLAMYRYLSPAVDPILGEAEIHAHRCVIHYRDSGDVMKGSEVTKIETLVLPKHAP